MQNTRLQNTLRVGVCAATVLLLVIGFGFADTPPGSKGSVLQTFKAVLPDVADKNANIQYDLDPSAESFAVFVPKEYNEKPGWGLVVYIDSGDDCPQLPAGWEPVLRRRKLLAIIPQRAGNEQTINRRLGLAVLGAREMMALHKIDPKRVYAAGLSGGARMAGLLGFFAPSIFKGTIQSCGADFCGKVPQVAKRGPNDRGDDDYGVFPATDAEIAAAKSQVRFVFITGTNDFRHAAIVDIFHGGYEKAGFNAKLIDVPDMPHQPAGAKHLSAALDFIERPAPTTAATTRPPGR